MTERTYDEDYGLRRCTKCGILRPKDQFYKKKGGREGLHPWCKICSTEHHRRVDPEINRAKWRDYEENHRTPGSKRDALLRRKYGITLADFDAVIERQDGLCALCGTKPERFSVYRENGQGEVVGAICPRCQVRIARRRQSGVRDELPVDRKGSE